jgi:response regulator RpfG family c-di-GMP phosphodiesterase/tRNA A-37 threonylcarbamoyl transferase component Bud32
MSRSRFAAPAVPDNVEELVYDLLGSSLVLAEDWERLTLPERELLLRAPDSDSALGMMIERGLLTPFQATRIATGNSFGLVLGNFRVLERLGAGGMAVVYKAEHIEMRHLVAIKVLQMTDEDDPRLQTRFSAEMRAIARLRHPNIVSAMDAGRVYSPDPHGPVLYYLVMEYVPGEDLHEFVCSRGPLPVPQACNLIHQIAAALAETQKLSLVHRDIKPSNILVTPEEQAKLLDFGLSRHTPTKLTQAGTVLGTIDYMAPEQARDASTVDIRADIYSLGGTLFWSLTGELPFPADRGELELLMRRLTQQPPSLRRVLPDVDPALDDVVRKMMALSPADRYATPQEVMRALLPFLKPGSVLDYGGSRNLMRSVRPEPVPSPGGRTARVLVIDDEEGIRLFCRELLAIEDIECHEASSGETGLEAAKRLKPDLVLLDFHLPGMNGAMVLRELRERPPTPNLKVLMFSGQSAPDDLAGLMLAGADDFLTKPFSVPQFYGRVKTALRLKEAQDRSDDLNHKLLLANSDLERTLSSRGTDLHEVRSALVMGLARLVQMREGDGGQRLERMRRYVRALAEEAATLPAYAGQIDEAFIELVATCAPLHDIGKVGLPDHILLKPGKLAPDERILMQAHTTIGAQVLKELADEHAAARTFLTTAADIVRSHHERHDGAGYPDRLSGPSIPLAARLVAVADVYDALRCRRSYKPALAHQAAVQLITESSPGQFDPALMPAFQAVASKFEQTFKEWAG